MAFIKTKLQIQKRQELSDRADSYYREWQRSRASLEKTATDYGKKLLIISIIGFTLLIIFRLLRDSNSEKSNFSFFSKNSRIGSAFQSLMLPIILSSIKKMIMGETVKDENQNDTDVDQ